MKRNAQLFFPVSLHGFIIPRFMLLDQFEAGQYRCLEKLSWIISFTD